VGDHQLRKYESILGLTSSEENPTPLVRLNRVIPFKHATVYAKLEWYNPFGAVKDRVANNLIRDAEEKGTLGEVRKLVEPTSGNTGMGLVMVANAKGYELTTPLSKAIPLEKRTVLRFFGCDVIELDDNLCPAPGAPEGAIAMAMDLGAKDDFHMLNQYENPANPEAHYLTTGPEIWKQTEGKVTHFVAGLGTCGTITGTGRFLKEKNSAIQVKGVHPAEGHDIPGVRSLRQLKQTKLFFPDEYDQTVEINNETAYALCARLNQEESIIAGPSSAMALAGALKMVPDEPGVVAVVIFPDNIFKYATSVRKHVPELFPVDDSMIPSAPSPSELMMDALVKNARTSPDNIDAADLSEMIDAGDTAIVDVRTPVEFDQVRLKNTVNIPLNSLKANAEGLPEDRTKNVVMICASGARSLSGMLVMKSLGYQKVHNLDGGLQAAAEAGIELER
jgi:cysteine synthase/rhodanese-related sulfurtransferase